MLPVNNGLENESLDRKSAKTRLITLLGDNVDISAGSLTRKSVEERDTRRYPKKFEFFFINSEVAIPTKKEHNYTTRVM